MSLPQECLVSLASPTLSLRHIGLQAMSSPLSSFSSISSSCFDRMMESQRSEAESTSASGQEDYFDESDAALADAAMPAPSSRARQGLDKMFHNAGTQTKPAEMAEEA